jgi:outer membrane protein assembly factor BamB
MNASNKSRSIWLLAILLLQAFILLVSQAGFLTSQARAEERQWPRWRGPDGNGVWAAGEIDRPLDSKWQPEWRQAIGPGFSGVTLSDGRVYTMDRIGGDERVICWNVLSGKQVWLQKNTVDYGDLDYGKGPRASVTIAKGRAFCQGAMGDLICRDATTGNVIWAVHLVDDLGGELPMWGFAASPVIHEDMVIVHPGGKGNCYVALALKDGSIRWEAGNDPAGYATPMVADFGGKSLVIGWTPQHIVGIDANSGQEYWKYPYEVTYGVSIATPIIYRDIVFVSGYWEGSRALQISQQGKEVNLLWEDKREIRGLMAQPLQREGLAFLLDRSNGIVCFDLKTGKTRWADSHKLTPRGRNPQATLVWLGSTDRFAALNSQGELVVGRLTPDGLVEAGRTTLSGDTWAHPAYGLGRVIVRDDQQIICFRTTRKH